MSRSPCCIRVPRRRRASFDHAHRGSVRRVPKILPIVLAIVTACSGETASPGHEPTMVDQVALQSVPAQAVPVPADYDGDGLTDFALKGSNGVWYIDMAACSGGRCLGPDGFGGRWDFAYPGYGDAAAIPVPADYGRSDGSVDFEHKVDLAVKDASGMWAIDYADNGFGTLDVIRYAYGDSSVVPVPADYDGDGRADLAIKTSDGKWYIDLAADGFGSWEPRTPFSGYGNGSVVPVPADYDGDGCADLAIKDPAPTGTGAIGTFYIDYARDGGSHCGLNGFRGWDGPSYSAYGDASAVPAIADYDGDGKADLSVKDAGGTWHIDYASNGFGGWDDGLAGYGGSWSTAIPGHYDATRDPQTDKRLDLSVKDTNGYWSIDLGANGFHGWDPVPGTTSTDIFNPGRPLYNPAQPHIEWTRIYSPIDGSPSLPRAPLESNELAGKARLVNGDYQLRIGVRYTVAVRINPGGVHHAAGLEVNPDLHVPASLALENPVASTGHIFITSNQTRTFGVTCTQPGSFPLGYMFRDAQTLNAFNPDYGIRITCTSLDTGLYGTVTARVRESSGRYVASATGIGGAKVRVTGPVTASTTTLSDGRWSLPQLTGGPYTVTVTAAHKAQTVAVNVTVPAGSGTEVDTPLEETFNLGSGIAYTTYVDYARGRTVLHVIRVDAMRASVQLARSELVPGTDPSGGPIQVYKNLVQIAAQRGAPVLMNGGYFDAGGPLGLEGDTADAIDDAAVGYFYGAVPPSYKNGFVKSIRLATGGELPMLGIVGTAANQQISIFSTMADFLADTSDWTQTASGPIFDRTLPKQVSDFTYAMQMEPVLLMNGVVAPVGSPDMAWARTTVGVGKNWEGNTSFWLVVGDGEGVNGGNGATFHQLGLFYKDVLGATEAMALDGGLSTELVLRSTSGAWRNVNTITGEDSSWDIDAKVEGEIPEQCCGTGGISGGIGSVFNYVSVASRGPVTHP